MIVFGLILKFQTVKCKQIFDGKEKQCKNWFKKINKILGKNQSII